MSRLRILPPLAVGAIALLLAGCATPSSDEQLPEPASSETASAAPASTCVTDPEAVVAAELPASATGPMPAELAATIDAAATASFAEAAAPGAVVLVQTPEGTFSKAYGFADPDTASPMTTDVHHRVGSITKTFTGTLLMQLASDGELSLDDTIDQYIDDVPNGDIVTLRQLANMTSGVASYTVDKKWEKEYTSHPERVWEPQELVDLGISLPSLFEPGTEFNYSNTNTILLGKVIEDVTGEKIADVYRERIFEPLGLTGTSDPGQSAAFPDPHARGFTLQSPDATQENPTDATDWNPSWGWTAGELISTAQDLLVYGRALGTGQGLLEPEAQIERLTSFPGSAGYGIAWGCVDGWVGHGGELPGYNTSVFYDTTSDTTVITLANSDIASGDCTQSQTLLDNPADLPCSGPAARMFAGISVALGHEFTPPAKQ